MCVELVMVVRCKCGAWDVSFEFLTGVELFDMNFGSVAFVICVRAVSVRVTLGEVRVVCECCSVWWL